MRTQGWACSMGTTATGGTTTSSMYQRAAARRAATESARGAGVCSLTNTHNLLCPASLAGPLQKTRLRSVADSPVCAFCACGLHSRGHVPIGDTCKDVHLYQTLSGSPRAHTDHRRDVR